MKSNKQTNIFNMLYIWYISIMRSNMIK